MKTELDNKLMMVVTRGQTGSDGPVTPTTSTAASVRHNTNVTITPEAGSAGRCGERAASTDPATNTVNGTQTSQAGTNTRSTQMGSTLRSGLPWLPTDDESGMEPEDPYSQGDRPDSRKTDWERTVGGAMGGNRRLAPPHVLLVEDAECREERVLNSSSLRACDEPRLYRERVPVTNASSGIATYGIDGNCTADYGEPEVDGYIARDPWYTQSQSGRPCPETVWGNRTAMSSNVPEPERPNVSMPGEEDASHGARHRTVPLDAPDVALRGQRLRAYGERLWREEVETGNPGAGRAHHPARPRRPTARQEWLEPVEGQMPAQTAAVGRANGRMMGQPRPLRAEERIYVEPPGAPGVGRRPLDLNVGHPNVAQNEHIMLRPVQPHQETPVHEDYYRAAVAPRPPHRMGAQMQPRLAKLDTFKGENGERLDDFVYQVEEFAAFHAWDQIETCRQARTHLRGVALAYVRRAPLPPRTWEELKDLLTRRFQPCDLTSAYKAQFRARRRQRNEDIHTYVDTLQKLAEMAWPYLDPLAREEMVADQFLTGLDNHELCVQAATSDVRRIEDLMRITRSLEAVEGEENGRGCMRRSSQMKLTDPSQKPRA